MSTNVIPVNANTVEDSISSTPNGVRAVGWGSYRYSQLLPDLTLADAQFPLEGGGVTVRSVATVEELDPSDVPTGNYWRVIQFNDILTEWPEDFSWVDSDFTYDETSTAGWTVTPLENFLGPQFGTAFSTPITLGDMYSDATDYDAYIQFTGINTGMKVLIVDQNNAAADILNSQEFVTARLFFQRLGAEVVMRRHDDISAGLAAVAWDLVVFPHLDGAAGASYTNLYDTLTATVNARAAFVGHAIPGAGQTQMGVDTVDASTVERVCDTVNWKDDSVRQLTFYGRAVTALASGSNAVAHFTDSTGDICMWSNEDATNSIPTLWQAGHDTSNPINNSTTKYYLGAQWAADHGATIPRKAVVMLRCDAGLSNSDAVTHLNSGGSYITSNELDDVIEDAVNTGYPEIQLAVSEDGSNVSDTNNISETYFTERDLTLGTLSPSFGTAAKIFRMHNHITDVVDNASDKCTSNGVLYDQPDTARTAYRADCDAITSGRDIQLGEDGYGSGYPNVQNANDMNYPALQFLWEQGAYPWVLYSETDAYPQDAVHGLTADYPTNEPTVRRGIPHLIAKNWDTISSAGLGRSVTMNTDVMDIVIAGGGGLYFHLSAGFGSDFGDPDVHQEFFDIFVGAPDVMAGDWPTQKSYVDALAGSSSASSGSGNRGRRQVSPKRLGIS